MNRAPKDAMCNRLAAMALEQLGLVNEAIPFWQHVAEALPNDAEARDAIAALMIQKARPRSQPAVHEPPLRGPQQEETREQRTRHENLPEPSAARPERTGAHVKSPAMRMPKMGGTLSRRPISASLDDEYEAKWDRADLLLLSAIGILAVVVLGMFFPQFHSLGWYWTRAVWYWRTKPSVHFGLPTVFFVGLVVLLWIRARRK